MGALLKNSLVLLKVVLSIFAYALAPFTSRTTSQNKASRLSQYPPSLMRSLENGEGDNVCERLSCFGLESGGLAHNQVNSSSPQPRGPLDTAALSIAYHASCSPAQLELGDTSDRHSLSSFLSNEDHAAPPPCSSIADRPNCLPSWVAEGNREHTESRFPVKSAPITPSLIPVSFDMPLVKTRWLPYQLTDEFLMIYNTRLPEVLLVDPSKPWMLPIKAIRFNIKLGQGGNGEVWSGQLQTFSTSAGWQVDCDALSGHTTAIKFEAGYLFPSDTYSGVPPNAIDSMKYEAEALLACRGASIVCEEIPGETAQWFQDPKLPGQVDIKQPDFFPKIYFYQQIHPLSTVYGLKKPSADKLRSLYVTGMELLYGSVAARIYDVGKGDIMDELEVVDIIQDLLFAVAQYHSRDMSHSDNKPENICFGQDGILKLIDFGHASEINPGGSITVCGTTLPRLNAVPHARPANLPVQRYDQAKADVYSIGTTMLRMLSVHWDGKSQRVVRKSATLEAVLKWGYLYPETGMFLSRLMDPNPKTRYDTREAFGACKKWTDTLYRRYRSSRRYRMRFTTLLRDSRLLPCTIGLWA